MQFTRRFDEEARRFFSRLGEPLAEDRRAESIDLAERGVGALGLNDVVSAYLSSTFQAEALAELSDDDLARALRFIAALFGQRTAAHLPIAPGTEGDGEVFWMRGRFRWGNERAPTATVMRRSWSRFGMD